MDVSLKDAADVRNFKSRPAGAGSDKTEQQDKSAKKTGTDILAIRYEASRLKRTKRNKPD
ncbi:hypothetical protein ASZ90_020043 [hydrocarbon metagenome]|uniref:Uncharacterized protein n=1 Tax=hydrocarbon metagenome TaxID=938273 RepID=A0A0W8E2K3_9ZZZZ